MSTYRIEVSYGDGEPQPTEGLSLEQARDGSGAFLRDMLGLPGSAITRFSVVREEGS
jgi:hypothetical protein